jgi:hypothetical protein
MVRVLAMGAAFVLLACDPPGATAAIHQAASLSRSDAEQVMLRADELRRLAFEFPDTTNLSEAFGRSALHRLQAQSRSLGMRGMHEEERSPSRDLVFWDPVAQEAVLQIVAERRLVTRDQPNSPWSATVRQWWARLQNVEGSWKVVDEEDLPPDRWRPVSPGL